MPTRFCQNSTGPGESSFTMSAKISMGMARRISPTNDRTKSISRLIDVYKRQVRFGIEMLMTFYLDGEFQPEYLDWVAAIHSEEYYVNMMIAWYFATALAKQWDAAQMCIRDRM